MNKVLLIFALLPALGTIADAADQPLDKVVTNRYRNRILALRQPVQSDYQEYDFDGKPLMVAPDGPWTVYRGVVVKKIVLDPGKLRLEGRRALYVFNKDCLTPFQSDNDIRITIRLKNSLLSEDEVAKVLSSIFTFNEEDIINSAPPYWRPYLSRKLIWNGPGKGATCAEDQTQKLESGCVKSTVKDPTESGAKVFRLGDAGVTPPKILFQPEPEFSEYARKLHLAGIVGLNIVVDSTGAVSDVAIVKPMGAGLDEKAVNAVRTWRFDPAKKAGQPVAVAVYVEVDFHYGF